jgi:hypothetical protein
MDGKMNKRRNLSGIFIFEKFEGEEKRLPTCYEDCTEATQEEWLKSLSKEQLISLAKNVGKTLREIGDMLNIEKE